jgi:predicted amino acid dehydrogenase
MASNLLKLDPKALTVGIVGYTGEAGKALSKEILKNSFFKSTVLIGRRNVDYNESYYKSAVIILILVDNV